MRKFFCQNCNKEIPLYAEECPSCGKKFGSVLCPKCNYKGKSVSFANGCPKCGYLKNRKNTPEKVSLIRFVSLFLLLLTIISILIKIY